MKVTLYTTGCPRCKTLKQMLIKGNIEFEECTDVNTMISMGLDAVPALEIDGRMMNYTESIQWIKECM